MISHEPQRYQTQERMRTVYGRGEQFSPVEATFAHVWPCAHLVRRAAAVASHARARGGGGSPTGTIGYVDDVSTNVHLVTSKEKGSELTGSQDMRGEGFGACGTLCEVGLCADGRMR